MSVRSLSSIATMSTSAFLLRSAFQDQYSLKL